MRETVMVKKIKFIEEEIPVEVMDEQTYQTKMLEYQKSMDWKVWEILKLMQSMAETTVSVDDTDIEVATPAKLKSGITPIIVEEDQ
jgi:hypothetical protein